jgi:hypothetical protein
VMVSVDVLWVIVDQLAEDGAGSFQIGVQPFDSLFQPVINFFSDSWQFEIPLVLFDLPQNDDGAGFRLAFGLPHFPQIWRPVRKSQ